MINDQQKNNEIELTMESCTLHTLHSACYCCLSSFITIIHLQSSISIKIEAHSGVKRRVSTAEGMSRGRDRAFGAFLAADHLGTPNSFQNLPFFIGKPMVLDGFGVPQFHPISRSTLLMIFWQLLDASCNQWQSSMESSSFGAVPFF